MDKKLFDKAIDIINERLERELRWLKKAYGRTVKRTTVKEEVGKKVSYNYPSLYKGNHEYENMLPSDSRRNVCFWNVQDEQTVDAQMQFPRLTAKVSCIFWVKLTDIFAEVDYAYTEHIKEDVLNALHTCPYIVIKKVIEQPDNVFKEYTVKDVPVQFLMFPYYALRVEMEMKVQAGCIETSNGNEDNNDNNNNI